MGFVFIGLGLGSKGLAGDGRGQEQSVGELHVDDLYVDGRNDCEGALGSGREPGVFIFVCST